MSYHTEDQHLDRTRAVVVPAARELLNQLLLDAKGFRSSEQYLDMLEFAARMKHMAPFNAMLLRAPADG